MREFTRITLRVLMCLFLLVGCGYNIYYMGAITEDNAYASYRHNRARHKVTYDDNGYNEYQQPQELVEGDTVEVEITNDRPVRQFYY